MALSKEQLEEILVELEKKQIEDLKAKNLDGIGSHYHPDAVMVNKTAKKAYYGREEIKESFKPFFEAYATGTNPTPSKPSYAGSSGDGEYIIRRGTYTFGSDPKEFPFEVIYKKHEGKYLAYHDEFSA
ncbi:hypothetical protein M3Y97_01009900 [Aphelenchoides bicaudatus]|nr:hypothetical protein M3Y97_01009900 [Aphelenchoides bicaudatus]